MASILILRGYANGDRSIGCFAAILADVRHERHQLNDAKWRSKFSADFLSPLLKLAIGNTFCS
ncbi:hypothetical protein [Chamaesiphon sp. OTE_8_metabat_110]|uniref:hypothetical protein n=1 Tax=Chamaesiphon sp. OTE_8_metabat_110 TaxID=2964696 RepID=UPI00286B5B85|nr:hypothetical protein [Chamaesiphon sp. OTE_8_metabat_110]